MSTPRLDPVAWAQGKWLLPRGERLVLRPWQREVLRAMFPADGSPSPYETFLISTTKKGGKTTLNAIATTYAALHFPPPETAFVIANDQAQAQENTFDLIASWAKRAGLEAAGAAVVLKDRILFPDTGTRIVALPADFAGSAGPRFGVSSFTELWAFRHEQHVRLWEELTPNPNRRSLRIVDSYAGFTGDAPVLEPLWTRALAGVRIHDELPIYADGRLWAFIDQGEDAQRRAWLGDPAEMDAYYAEQAASLRPGTFNRLHLNMWQTGEEAFVTAEDWDECVDHGLVQTGRASVFHPPVFAGVDAATKSDSAAVVVLARVGDRVRLVDHRIWRPGKSELDLEATIERYLLGLRGRGMHVQAVYYDPYQFQRSASTMRNAGLRMVELPQTSSNLTAAGQALFDLVKARGLVVYPASDLREHVLNAVAVDSGRGWRLAKEKASRKIDAAAALSFACLAVLREPVLNSISTVSEGRMRWGPREPQAPPDPFGVPVVPGRSVMEGVLDERF